MPALKHDNKILTTDTEKATTLAEYLGKQNSLTNNYSDILTINTVNESAENIEIQIIDECSLTSIKEIKDISKTLKIKKAPGKDKVPNIILRNLSKTSYNFLSNIFNGCLKLGYFPNRWKVAIVTCIPKPGKDRTLVESYRPISLLNTVGKLFEKIIKIRIEKFLLDNNILPNEQFGFRSNHSTYHQVCRIKNFIQENLNNKKSVGMVTLDIEKAFDSVWHNGLIHKLASFEFPVYITKLIASFLKDRCFFVRVGSEYSKASTITSGVPQGSTLSPFLYNIYIADLPKLPNCEIGLYADDTALLTTSSCPAEIINNLENGLRRIQDFYYKWKIKLNGSKTKAIFFTKRRKSSFLPNRNLVVNNTEIFWENNYITYLGIHLDKKLSFKTHIIKTIEKVNFIIRLLYPLINKKSLLKTENKMLIFRTIFRSIILYGFPVWSNAAKTNLNVLQKKQNSILKLILNKRFYFSTRKLHDLAHINYVTEQIDILLPAFQNSCRYSLNPLIQAIVD